MDRLSLTAQTLYAELTEQVMAVEASRSIGRLPGSVTTKEIKGKRYYYYQYRDVNNKVRQIYLDSESEAFRRALENFASEKTAAKSDLEDIERLCGALRAAGATTTPSGVAKILQAFSASGMFWRGAVLVGTHAFAIFGNMLGVRWEKSAAVTQDIDVAQSDGLSLAVPNQSVIDVPGVLQQLRMGFLPVPQFDSRHPSTSFRVRGKELRVDFLTPLLRPTKPQPVLLRELNIAAQPLRFLDYLIESPDKAVAIADKGIMVQVPDPARYALHKLLVSHDRAIISQTKVKKDLNQVAQLIEVLLEDRPGDVSRAWRDLKVRGGGWVKRVTACVKALGKEHPEAGAGLMKKIPELSD
ncbi:MAG: GSU2403 family nucleotidyltransferase fold protein [Burkholderiales bacterium]